MSSGVESTWGRNAVPESITRFQSPDELYDDTFDPAYHR